MLGTLIPKVGRPQVVPGRESSAKVILAIALWLLGCQRTDDKEPQTNSPVRASARPHAATTFAVRPTCPDKLDNAFFFPVASLGERQANFDEDASLRSWASDELRKMLEPSLSCGDIPGDTFRFTWLRSFHPPVSVRVFASSKSAQLVAILMSGSGGYAPAAAVDQPHRALSSAEWNDLNVALVRSDFWNLPSWRGRSGPDGAEWIVEGRVGSQYHAVNRWAPRSGTFRDLGLLFLKLAKLGLSEREIY
jgi:hypothetical protein